jgi:sodium/pantothenate symporter
MSGSTLQTGPGTIAALLLFIAASVWIGAVASRAMRRGTFMRGFFLGNRGLGAWALALTATVQSGGSFMGFPSLVYTHGWIVALWIAGYMVVPITGFGILGKRLAELSRRTGAITVPDLFRARFGSPGLGLLASLFILFYMTFMMVAQFKAGAIVMKLAWPGTGSLAAAREVGGIDVAYYVGLAIFTITVVGYTLLGGFLAAVWTDLFQSVMMWLGVVFLLILTLGHVGSLEQATLAAAANTGPEFAFGPGYDPEGQRAFLPLGLAFSFFALWVFAGIGSPSGMVRIMACKSTGTIRRSIYLLSVYNAFIYIPLVVICVCGRALIPDLRHTDEIVPRMALRMTEDLPFGTFWGGLILAAPFGAVMATVSSYLVVIASGLVRDVYQRFLNPHASTRRLRCLSYAAMILVGAIAVAANLRPVAYLQAIVVFSGSGAAATFCMPGLLLAYWRRATVPGMIAGMLGGAGTLLTLYISGFLGIGGDPLIGQVTSFRPYYLLGIDPIVWGLLVSLCAGVTVSLLTAPPDPAIVSTMFDARPDASGLADLRSDSIDSHLTEDA